MDTGHNCIDSIGHQLALILLYQSKPVGQRSLSDKPPSSLGVCEELGLEHGVLLALATAVAIAVAIAAILSHRRLLLSGS